jgi:hypothetical protein
MGRVKAGNPDGMRFPFRFARSYRPLALALGITPATAYVEVADGHLRVRYGLWWLETPLANVVSTERTGGFTWLKTVGPPHLSLADRGVSFTTNGDDALCVRFHEPVKVLDPTGRLRHPAATLSVADPAALDAALDRAS